MTLVREPELRQRGGAVAAARRRWCLRPARRLGDAARAGRERIELERAHRAVPEDRAGAGDLARVALAVRGPTSSPIQPSGTSTPSSSLRSGRRRSVAEHEVAGQLEPAAAAAAASSARRAGSTPSASQSEAPTAWPCAAKNGKHIAPPIRIASATSRKRSITPILSVTFAPPTIATSGSAGSPGCPFSVVDLALEQPPCGRLRDVVGDALGRGVRAVRGAERVVDVDVGELAPAGRELGVVLRLPRLVADVLEQQHLAGPSWCAAPSTLVADDARRELHRTPSSSDSRSPTGRSDSSGSRSFGRPRCETSTSAAPRSRSSVDRRQRRADARVVRDRPVLRAGR